MFSRFICISKACRKYSCLCVQPIKLRFPTASPAAIAIASAVAAVPAASAASAAPLAVVAPIAAAPLASRCAGARTVAVNVNIIFPAATRRVASSRYQPPSLEKQFKGEGPHRAGKREVANRDVEAMIANHAKRRLVAKHDGEMKEAGQP